MLFFVLYEVLLATICFSLFFVVYAMGNYGRRRQPGMFSFVSCLSVFFSPVPVSMQDSDLLSAQLSAFLKSDGMTTPTTSSRGIQPLPTKRHQA